MDCAIMEVCCQSMYCSHAADAVPCMSTPDATTVSVGSNKAAAHHPLLSGVATTHHAHAGTTCAGPSLTQHAMLCTRGTPGLMAYSASTPNGLRTPGGGPQQLVELYPMLEAWMARQASSAQHIQVLGSSQAVSPLVASSATTSHAPHIQVRLHAVLIQLPSPCLGMLSSDAGTQLCKERLHVVNLL